MITVSGTVTDLKNGGPVAGAVVMLKVKEVSGGTFSNSFATIESTTTSSSGTYSFTFENRTASEYKLTAVVSNYFSFEEVKNPDVLSTSQANTWNAGIYPMAWYRVNIVNASPYDSNDQVTYQINEGANLCATCCQGDAVTYVGDVVNETIECVTHGETWLKFQWFVTKNSASWLLSDSVYCTSFDTTEFNLNY